MLKTLEGAVPVIDVNMPSPAPVASKSSHRAMNVVPYPTAGRQLTSYPNPLLLNWMLPFELSEALVYGVPYTVTAKGKVIAVTHSSQWLPTSVVPGTIEAPVVEETA